MLFVRSALFNLCFFILTPICSVLILLFRPFGFHASWFWAKVWSKTTLWLATVLCGIRVAIEGKEYFLQGKVTGSVGIAHYGAGNFKHESVEEAARTLRESADDALYEAKDNGRNQSVHSDGAKGIPQNRFAK